MLRCVVKMYLCLRLQWNYFPNHEVNTNTNNPLYGISLSHTINIFMFHTCFRLDQDDGTIKYMNRCKACIQKHVF